MATDLNPFGSMAAIRHEAFDLFGQPGARSPLVFAVPHAGRLYSAHLLARARVTPATLHRLEDRLADLLVHELIARGHCVLIAKQPRALIDLNRDEREIDPHAIAGLPRGLHPQSSAKVRGGLGLVPERLAYAGQLWRHPLPYAELIQRIEQVHRPYHAALADALRSTRARHGTSLLIDIHSMPPLPTRPSFEGPTSQIVIGDRFGKSAASRLTDLAVQVARHHCLAATVNAPYSGNHILERHGRPEQGIHAIQIEVDRSLYLNSDLMTPGANLSKIRDLLSDIGRALAAELSRPGIPLAAE